MAVRNHRHSGVKTTEPSVRERIHSTFARKAAAEGMVLLKNEGVLPFAASTSIALFGGGAVRTVKGGIGSGEVNSRKNISIYQGLKDIHTIITSEDWIADYEKRYEAARNAWKERVLGDAKHVENPFDAYAANPFSFPDGRRIMPDDIGNADAVVYVISRIAGEGKDRRKAEGDYYLSKKEQEDICYLNQTGIPIVLLLNAGAAIELADVIRKTENVKAILNISLPGQEGGNAVADVLFGYASPGGRLTATWAEHYEDYPSAGNYGYLNGNLETEEYREGIYVGYRYFDTFGIEPLFPFGYGLSYTDFSMEFKGIQKGEAGFELAVSVKNSGETYAGREVVQVYVMLPQAGMVKERKRLVGFAKTRLLKPQEEQILTIFVEERELSSYSEELHAWVMEAGDYDVRFGNHIASLQQAEVFTVQNQRIVEEVQRTALETQTFAKPEYPVEDLIPLLYGNITQGASNLGSAGIRVPGSAGETTEALENSYGIRSLIMADGPAGLRLCQSYEVDPKTDSVYGVGVLGALENGFLAETANHEGADTYYQYCTAFPVGTALAQSWDKDLMKKFGEVVSAEMEEFQVDLWLAPGMNIHRNPLCGRNFEYYSEDPFLSGIMAAAVTQGVQKSGKCGVVVKHFACNNQEDNRMGVDVRVSERALREIYLRGFEIAVKKSSPMALMSSYNRINGVYAANSRELCTGIAREEWKFDGVIMTDWNTTVPEDGSVPWKCVAAGNDIIMPGSRKDDEDIRRAYKEGRLSEEMIRSCAGRIFKMIHRLTV